MFSFEISDHAKLMDDMTASLPRPTCLLLSLSYVVSRDERSSSISIAHVIKAYHSRRYAAHRADVEVIHRQRANPQKVVRVDGKPRWDLFCPFQAADVDAQHVQAAKDARQENVASRRLAASFSPAEKKIVQSAVTSVGATVDSMQKCERAKSVPRPKTGKELLSNEACVMELMRKRGSFER